MRFLTDKQISEKWEVSVRRVQDLCKNGMIIGAERHGREWLIPEFAEKPVDQRTTKTGEARVYLSQLDQTQFVNLITRYKYPGSAKEIMNALNDRPIAKEIFNMQLLFYKGEIKKSLEIAQKYLNSNGGFAQHILIGSQLSLCSMALGDTENWYKAQEYLKDFKTNKKAEVELLEFLLAANASSAYDGSLFPDWFRRGDFAHLPQNMQAIARFHYVKYLYIMTHDESCIQHNIPKLEFIRIMPLIIEPLISQAIFEGNVINEAYLRLMCAASYHFGGEDNLALKHIDKAIDILLPDRLFMPLAEYRNRLGSLLDSRLSEGDEKALVEIKKLSKSINSGWIKLHNAVMKRNVSDSLSFREREIAKLAIYGLSNKEIGDRLGISVNAVKLALRSTMDKTGANSRSELYHFV